MSVERMHENIADRFFAGDSIAGLAADFEVDVDEVEGAIRKHGELRPDESALAARSEEWRRMLRAVVELDGFHEDETDDPRVLRECLVRTRLGAASERQCSTARSVVLDLKVLPKVDGEPDATRFRFLISVPTGDLGELRETARSVIAAFFLGARDADAVEAMLKTEAP